MFDEILENIALCYGVTRRQLTVGQIEDFFERETKKVIREKEAKRELLSNKEKEKDKPSKERSEETLSESLIQFRAEFTPLWNRYPRKRGSRDALRHFIAARRSGVPLQTIADGLDNYIAYIKRNGINPNYIKYGSSWFCQHSWDDDYSGTYSRGRGQNLTDEEAERIAREVLYGSEDIN